MALIEQGVCKIEKLNISGLGEGKTEQGPVRLPYVLPGDVAEFERHSYRGKTDTILKRIIEANASRKDAVCEYFGACGGCLLQHMHDEEYAKFKLRMIEEPLAREKLETKLLPLVTVPFGQRRRANLEGVKKNGQVYLGFHRFQSHQIINIAHCPALLPELSALIAPLKETLEIVMEDREKFVMFVTKAASGIDIGVEIHNRVSLEENKRVALKDFAIKNNIARLTFRHRKKLDMIHGSGPAYVIFGGVEVEIDSHCFLQSSDLSDIVLSDLVVGYLCSGEKASEEKVLDLFCGRGTYTIPLSKNFASVYGFECDAKALKALGQAALKSNLLINLAQRDLFTYPLEREELGDYKKCIINPPRAGAEAQIRSIAQSNLESICYVSCSPETFVRDAKILASGGYKLTEVTPFDQFYYSPHLEVVGHFVR